MEREPRVVLITSNGLRHRFVASKYARQLNLVGIVSEAKTDAAVTPESPSPEDQAVIDRHFAERDRVERRFMGEKVSFPDTEVLTVPYGVSNSPEVRDWVGGRQPDFVLLYGSSIIKPPLLSDYGERVVNLHLGLSPYYRGSGTNFWALVKREPECVGATIHLAVVKVDAGAILAQVRPEAEAADRAHELGTKTIIAGLELMPRILELCGKGKIAPRAQDLTQGQVFRLKDFHAEAVREMWRQFDSGMMAEYLADAESRRKRYPIAELGSV
jgi:hypothetical protein